MILPIPLLGTTDLTARVSVVEGYNTNVEQTEDTPGGPVTPHPSPFTGADGMLELRVVGEYSEHDFRIEGRGQHYEPLEHFTETDDGTGNASWTSLFVLGKNDTVRFLGTGTVSKLNSARISDGIIYQFDPALLDTTFMILSGELSFTHEFSATWRLIESAGDVASYTFSQPPIFLQNGQRLAHKGLDYYQPFSESSLLHDFSPNNTGELRFVYQFTHAPVVYDFAGNVPVDIGPEDTQIAELTAGFSHHFSPEFYAFGRLGGTVSSVPPQSTDTRPIFEPTLSLDAYYTKPYWYAHAGAGYDYAALDPRLGAGATLSGDAQLVGTPIPKGAWMNFAVLFDVHASHTDLTTGAVGGQFTPSPVIQSTNLDLVAASAQIRYALNSWLGILGGYDLHYATFAGQSAFPPVFQNIVYLGLSGFFSTDRTTPTLTTFVPPLRSL